MKSGLMFTFFWCAYSQWKNSILKQAIVLAHHKSEQRMNATTCQGESAWALCSVSPNHSERKHLILFQFYNPKKERKDYDPFQWTIPYSSSVKNIHYYENPWSCLSLSHAKYVVKSYKILLWLIDSSFYFFVKLGFE